MKCKRCQVPAVVALPSHHTAFCKECFLVFARRLVERAIKEHSMFTFDDRILIAISGGKDSKPDNGAMSTDGLPIIRVCR